MAEETTEERLIKRIDANNNNQNARMESLKMGLTLEMDILHLRVAELETVVNRPNVFYRFWQWITRKGWTRRERC